MGLVLFFVIVIPPVAVAYFICKKEIEMEN